MKSSNVYSLLTSLRVVLLSMLVLPFLSTPVLHAQVLDTEAPSIGFDTIDQGMIGDAQVFTVSATDNQQVTSMVMFYRTAADEEYQSADMSRVGATDLYTYTVEVDAIPSSTESIEYYIAAADAAGNRTLQGFSFAPLERRLVARADALASGSEAVQEPSSFALGSLSTTQKVIYSVLGLIVVGALVSAADGGDDSSGGSEALTPVRIIVAEPTI